MKKLLFVLSFPTALLMLSASSSRAQGMPPTSVETEHVSSLRFHDQITLVGRTEARSHSQIVAEVSGRVIRVDAPEGNPVRQGATLVTIESRNAQYSVEAKRAEVEQAKAQAELKGRDLERSENLFKQGLISDGDIDEDRAAAIQAVELYHQREAELKQMELDLDNCLIRAPYNGFTVRKMIDIGEWVSPGTPVYELVDLSSIKVVVDLPEKHLGHVAIGSDVTITVSGDTGRVINGRVTGIAPNASSETHTFPVMVTVDNPGDQLGGGMLVRATVSMDEMFTSLSVPKDAIVRQGTQTMVYTVADGKAVPIPVQIASSMDDRVAVQGQGLSEGMAVVVRGNERIFPGSPVITGDEEEHSAPPDQPESGPQGDKP